MSNFILRRLGQSIVTIFSVMIFTFLLFRCFAGDIAAAHVGKTAKESEKAAWLMKHGYDRPWVFNYHKHLVIQDKTTGPKPFSISDMPNSRFVSSMGLVMADPAKRKKLSLGEERTLLGKYVLNLTDKTPLEKLVRESRVTKEGKESTSILANAGMLLSLSDGSSLKVSLKDAETTGQLLERINTHPANKGRVIASISQWKLSNLFETQFFLHLGNSVTFSARSLDTNKKMIEIIKERAPFSLALTIPAMALGWVSAMIVSCFVAYYRNTWLDKVGVFLSVLGMCIPYLAFLILGQSIMFRLYPTHAFGLENRANIYIPVAIMVIAGLGGSVRFYRTVILDEVNREYVRTAKAKGLSVSAILFRHVLKNCMLPILTNLILAIPFLMMGSLLVERQFGIPGLGDLLLTSVSSRDEPIMSGLVFLTALIYTIGMLLTDLSYALFDPRIRLR